MMTRRRPLAMPASGWLAGLLALGVVLAQDSDADAVRRRALTLAQTGDYAQARADLERLLSERPDDLRTRKLLARVLIAAAATSEAAIHLERVVAADPADAEGWSLLGRLHQDAQRFGAAAQALTRAVGLDPGDVPALTALANAYLGLDRIDDADATFARAVKANALRAKPSAEPHACQRNAYSSVIESWKQMSKAFTKETDTEDDEPDRAAEDAAHAELKGVKNYITPAGLQRLRDEHKFLLTRERPAVTHVVAWAAGNGDRSENADYQYGKRRLRQIDRRIRFLTKRIDAAEVVDPEAPRSGRAATHVFFGAAVRYANAAGTERAVTIVGLDEIDLERNYISWLSPLARALMKSGPGDRVVLHAPAGTEHLQILEVRYGRIPMEPFTEPPGAEAAPKARA